MNVRTNKLALLPFTRTAFICSPFFNCSRVFILKGKCQMAKAKKEEVQETKTAKKKPAVKEVEQPDNVE